MRIESGFWLSLEDQSRGRIIYQCATDLVTEEEFLSMWNQAGKIMLRELALPKATSMQFSIRAQRTGSFS